MRRSIALVGLCLAMSVVAAIGLIGFSGAAAASGQVSITSVNTSPETVPPGEDFTVTITLRNSASSESTAQITEVGIRGGGVLKTHDDLGAIGPGETMAVPVSVTLDRPGRYQLTAIVNTQRSGHVEYPVYVTVEDPGGDVGLSVSSPDPVAGDETTVNVTVGNGGTEPISSLTLTVGGEAITVRDPRRISPSLASGAETTFSFDVTFSESGSRELVATLDFRSAGGYDLTVTEPTTFEVESLRIDSELSARVQQNGTDRNIRASLENFGNVPLEDVVVRIERDGELLDRAQGPDVAPRETGTVTINANDFPEGDLELVASYEAADRTETVSSSLAFAPTVESHIALTGVDVAGSPDRLTLSGDAANVGSADADSVLLRVVPTDNVTPVNPGREYFVGAIDSSEFATFQLTAAVQPGTTELPVEVQYTVDGGRHSRIVTLDIGDVPTGPEQGSDRSDAGGSPFLVMGAVLLVVGVGGVYWWRRRR